MAVPFYETLGYTEEEMVELIRKKHKEEYINYTKIAEELGVVKSTIGSFARKHGIEANPSNLEYLGGKQFGYWLVTDEFRIADKNKKGGSTQWKCICTGCNKKYWRYAIHLKDKRLTENSKCRKCATNFISYDHSCFLLVFGKYKKGARRRNLSFNLNHEEFKKLIESHCYYCGEKHSNLVFADSCKNDELFTGYKYNGIDRVDNTKGYSVDNCVSCCKICNKMKLDLGYEEFLRHIKKIYNHRSAGLF